MSDNAVDLEILLQVKDALNALKDFSANAEKETKKSQSAFDSLKKVAVGLVAVFAAKEVLDFFGGGIEAANAQEQAMALLSQQMELTGSYSDEAAKSFADFADSMEKSTKYGDDVIVGQLAVAKSFGISNDAAQDLVKAATELSAVTGDSLDSSVKKLGLTYSGVTGKLDEQVPALKGLTKEALASGEAIKIITDRFGGSAAAEINTFAGATLQAKNAFGNFQESFGTAIIQNKAVVAAIKGVTAIFGTLQEIVESNSEVMDSFITGGLQALAAVISATVDVVYFFVRGFEGLVNITNLATVGFLELATFFHTVWRETIGRAYELLLDFAQGIVEVIGSIPGVGEAMGAIGVDVDAASSKIGDFRSGLTTMLDEGLKSTEGVRDGMAEFAVATNDTFESVNAGFEKFQGSVDGAAQSVFDADGKIVDSSKKANKARQDFARGTEQDAKELEKLREEAKKFAASVQMDVANEQQKLVLKLNESAAKIQEFVKAHVMSEKQGAALRTQIEADTIAKLEKLRDDDVKKSAEQAKAAADAARAEVEQITSKPFEFLVKAKTEDFLDPKKLAAAGTGFMAKALDGAAGAKSAISEIGGGIADSFMPGIGGAVSGILGKMSEGPEATKAMIKGFVDAIPDIVTAIAESAPVIVESLVDSLINEGGIVKIAVALARAMVGEALFKSIGKQLGIDFGSSLNASNIGQTIGNAFSNVFRNAFSAIVDSGFLQKLLPNFSGAADAFIQPVRALFNGDIKGAITGAIEGPFKVASQMLPGAIREPFEKFVSKIKNAFSDFFDFKFKLPSFPTPKWIQPFIDAIEALTGFGGFGGGGKGKLTGIPGSPIATGGIIPDGHPDDDFFARLTSNERVVPVRENESLAPLLADYNAGRLSVGGGGSDSAMLAMLGQILEAVTAPITTSAQVQFNQQTLADIMLNLQRRNARLSA
jgi:hypothetical protein